METAGFELLGEVVSVDARERGVDARELGVDARELGVDARGLLRRGIIQRIPRMSGPWRRGETVGTVFTGAQQELLLLFL